MTVQFACPNQACQSNLQIGAEYIGQQVRCPHCQSICVVPQASVSLTDAGATNLTSPLTEDGGQTRTMILDAAQQRDDTRLTSLDLFMRARGHGLVSIERAEELARGGMGAVIRGRDRILLRPLAMKVMHDRIAESSQHRLRFLEEAQITGQLEHPNIVPVHELGKDDQGNLYFTMKLVQGRSLGQIIKAMRDGDEADLSLSDLLTAFLKVCDGMAFAHSKNVIHRDLKPDNVMLGDYGEVLVMDWGLARIVQSSMFDFLGQDGTQSGPGVSIQSAVAGYGADATDQSTSPGNSSSRSGDRVRSIRSDVQNGATLAGTVMGTPAYMPPEQAAGDIDALDHRSDIYALGGLLYAILTLEAPVTGKNVTEILVAVTQGTIILPEQRTPERHIPLELSAVAMKAMRHDRSQRYQTVQDLARDIRRFMEGRDVSARRDSLVAATVKVVRRNPRAFITAACAAVVLIAVTAVFLFGLKSERDYAVAQWQIASKARAAAADAQREQYETAMTASEELARQALLAEEQGRFAEADLRAEAAVTLLKDGPWGHYAQAMLAHGRLDLDAAQRHLNRAIEAQQTHGPSRILQSRVLAATGDLKKAASFLNDLEESKDWRGLLAATGTFLKLKRYEDALRACERAVTLMEPVKGLTDEAREKAQYLLGYARAEVACIGFPELLAGLSPEEQKQRVLKKFREIHGDQDVITITSDTECQSGDPRCIYLQPLRGTTYTKLTLGTCQIRSIEPLRGQPLEFLEISATNVADLDPLRGMPLKTLNLRHLPITDLAPLNGLRVESMILYGLPVSDLSPLSGLPLKTLQLTSCKSVKDVTPLSEVPLETLNLDYTSVSDLSPLRAVRIKALTIHGARISDLSPRRGLASETHIAGPSGDFAAATRKCSARTVRCDGAQSSRSVRTPRKAIKASFDHGKSGAGYQCSRGCPAQST